MSFYQDTAWLNEQAELARPEAALNRGLGCCEAGSGVQRQGALLGQLARQILNYLQSPGLHLSVDIKNGIHSSNSWFLVREHNIRVIKIDWRVQRDRNPTEKGEVEYGVWVLTGRRWCWLGGSAAAHGQPVLVTANYRAMA